MRTFRCDCGARVFFSNSRCVACDRGLAFLPDRSTMATVVEQGAQLSVLGHPEGAYHRCGNHLEWGVCNWLVPSADNNPLCQACRLNEVIPNLNEDGHRELWADVELAKRHLIYTLNQLGLPVRAKADGPNGMAFRFMKDGPGREVLTGHADGVITLNLREADAVAREKARVTLREGYRTLLGHMRHEVGHCYWDILVRDSPHLGRCRAIFGDERADYAEALERHYSNPPPEGWHERFISTYATSHPWEDWAETWAHMMHMVDTLETAGHFGVAASGGNPLNHDRFDLDRTVDNWAEVTVVLNALNRSMGMPDAYPFAITDHIKVKLGFVAEVVRSASPVATPQAAAS